MRAIDAIYQFGNEVTVYTKVHYHPDTNHATGLDLVIVPADELFEVLGIEDDEEFFTPNLDKVVSDGVFFIDNFKGDDHFLAYIPPVTENHIC